MKRRTFLRHAGAVGSVALLSSCGPLGGGTSQGEDIVLGLIYTPSQDPETGTSTIRGANLAMEYLNNVKGGILGGRKFRFEQEDDHGEPATGVAGYRRLVTEKKVAMVWGLEYSSVTLAINEVAKDLGVPVMATYASNKDVTAKGYPIAFRMHAVDPVRAAAWLQLIKQKGYKRIGIVADDTDYGIGLINETKSQASALGLNLTLSENVVDHTAKDYTVPLLKIKDFKPDLTIQIVTSNAHVVLDQSIQLGLFAAGPYMMDADGPTVANWWQQHPKSAGIMFITYFSPSLPLSDAGKWFTDKYKAQHKEDPIYPDYNNFGSALVIAQAIEQAKSTDSKAIIQALETGSFTGWSAVPVTFPKKSGVLWHNWSPPMRIQQMTAEGMDWKKAPTIFEYTGQP